MDGFVNIGKVDCQAENNLCRSLQINAYPSVLLFISESQRYEISTRDVDDIIKKVTLLVDHYKSRESHDELWIFYFLKKVIF